MYESYAEKSATANASLTDRDRAQRAQPEPVTVNTHLNALTDGVQLERAAKTRLSTFARASQLLSHGLHEGNVYKCHAGIDLLLIECSVLLRAYRARLLNNRIQMSAVNLVLTD